jgi:hypothetical protein
VTGRALPALLLLGRTAVARPPARQGAGRRGRRRGAAVELAGRPEAAVQRHEGVAAPGVEAEGAVAPSRPRVHKLGEGGRGKAVVGRPEVHGEGESRGVGGHFLIWNAAKSGAASGDVAPVNSSGPPAAIPFLAVGIYGIYLVTGTHLTISFHFRL